MPESFDTVVRALLTHGAREPTRPFLSFTDGERALETWTFGDALNRAREAAGALKAHGLNPADRIVIVGGNEPDVVAVLLGAMGSGILPAIVHPPLRADVKAASAQLAAIVARAEPGLVVAPPELWGAAAGWARGISAGELLSSSAAPRELVIPRPDTPTYLQFSSGTTGGQKAVVLSAGAQAANALATGVEIRADDDEVWVSWLPLYHDMGLMAGVLIPLYLGHRSFLLPAERFVERPIVWLQALSTHQATLTVAPNFAYALVARRATPERLVGLDLSRVRVMFNGAEMVMPDTVAQFEAALAGAGLRKNCVYPVYGLAEFTLSAAYWRVGEPVRVDAVARGALAQGRAEPAALGERRVVRLASVGRAVHGHGLRVVGEHGHIAADREVGEIQVAGPSRMFGYLGEPALTAEALDGEWLRTGDLGYLADDDLFVCGRKKDLVIRFGENFYPADLESVAATCPGAKAGRLAVIGVVDMHWATERAWLVIESALTGEAATALAQTVRAYVVEKSGFKFDGVTLVPEGFIEKTSSGKVRRLALRDRLYGLFRTAPPPSVGRWPG